MLITSQLHRRWFLIPLLTTLILPFLVHLPLAIHILSAVTPAATELRWTTRASMPKGRDGLGVTSNEDIVYAIGGFGGSYHSAVVEAYDPTTNIWSSRASMPTPRTQLGVAALNGLIYAVGGIRYSGVPGLSDWIATAIVEVYDPRSNTWSSRRSMSVARSGAGIAVLNGKLYVAGGYVYNPAGPSEVLAIVEEYDPVTDTWTRRADLPTARAGLGLAAIGGKLYAIGGVNSLVEEFDPGTNTWVRRADMPTPRAGFSVVASHGKIFAFGGSPGSTVVMATVEEYDPVLDYWTQHPDMPTMRISMGVAEAKGELYIVGGLKMEGGGMGTRYTYLATVDAATFTCTDGVSSMSAPAQAMPDDDQHSLYLPLLRASYTSCNGTVKHTNSP